MKKSKFLPLALAFMLTTTMAFSADEGPRADSTFNMTVPKFLSIKVSPASVTSTPSANPTYTTLTLTNPPVVTYSVINNTYGQTVYLSALCNVVGGTADALKVLTAAGGDAKEHGLTYRIAYANASTSASAYQATATAVANALGSPKPEENPNVVAFNMTTAITPDDGGSVTGAVIDSSGTETNDRAKFTLTNGTYSFLCTVNGTSITDTFSPHDQQGAYQTILTLSEAAL